MQIVLYKVFWIIILEIASLFEKEGKPEISFLGVRVELNVNNSVGLIPPGGSIMYMIKHSKKLDRGRADGRRSHVNQNEVFSGTYKIINYIHGT